MARFGLGSRLGLWQGRDAFSAGGGGKAYGPDGANRFTIAELMRPWEQTAFLCGMHWIPPFVIHDAGDLDDASLAAEAARYGRWLRTEAGRAVGGGR